MRLFAKCLEITSRYPHTTLWIMKNCSAIVDQVCVLTIFFS